MAMSDRLHAPTALSPEKQPPVPIGQKAKWAPEPVWTLWTKEKSSCLSYPSPNLALTIYKTIIISIFAYATLAWGYAGKLSERKYYD
jgi:hypothetical protein